MESVVKQVSLGKESAEVVDFLAAIVKDIKMKKSLPEIALNLPKLVAAIEGYNLLGEEMKLAWPGAAGYLVSEVGAALMVPAPVEAPVEAAPQA